MLRVWKIFLSFDQNSSFIGKQHFKRWLDQHWSNTLVLTPSKSIKNLNFYYWWMYLSSFQRAMVGFLWYSKMAVVVKIKAKENVRSNSARKNFLHLFHFSLIKDSVTGWKSKSIRLNFSMVRTGSVSKIIKICY